VVDIGKSSFVVVANRLPVDRVTPVDGPTTWRRSPGGLVTALAPVMRAFDGAWVGWTGSRDDAPAPFSTDDMDLIAVPLSAEEIALYYEGFSNATLWPLYHDVIVAPEYHREWWEAYRRVNDRFARAAADVADHGAIVFVQDYQLQLVPNILRTLRPDLKIGFFLHIPFPPAELFAQLPWRRQILEGLLGADLVGFQRQFKREIPVHIWVI
jgi:trehalose 6-phosphate synthase